MNVMGENIEGDRVSRATAGGQETWSLPVSMLQDLYAQAPIGIYRSTLDGQPVFANPAFVRMMGYKTEAEWLRAIEDMEREWYVQPTRRTDFLREIANRGWVSNFESEVYVHKTGAKIWISETARAVKDAAGATLFFEGTIEDISERKRLESFLVAARRKAKLSALEDIDTGLPNRRALDEETQRLRHTGEATMVAALQIQRYHEIQNVLGATAAHQLIKAVADRLKRISPSLTPARIEPNILALRLDTAADIESTLESLQALVYICAQPVNVGENSVDVQLVVGLSGQTRADQADATDRARLALNQANEAGLHIASFDTNTNTDPLETLSLMSDMKAAMASGDVFVSYQPKFNLREFCFEGFEALVRWRRPDGRLIPPDRFVPVAETSGHINTLTLWMTRQIIKEQVQLAASGLNHRVAINLSARLLSDERFVAELTNILDVNQANLCFEITETALIQTPKRALKTLNMLRDRGFGISIDDYGTGLSSMAYLKQIPATELKIDRLFIKDILTDRSDRILVKSTIDLAHELGMTVVAEGVENADTLRLLRELGADLAQSFYIARPQPVGHWVNNSAKLLKPAPLPKDFVRVA